jgi:sulfatase maturation enzyme AslB (radical SAM superfamily)
MDFEAAKNAIMQAFKENPSEYDFLEIDFFGGEPLLAFDLIKKISEWTWNINWNKPFIFSVITNGTLLNEKMKDWFRKNKDRICLCLSYDGSINGQNTNRSDSLSKIDIDFFIETYPNQSLKMTISEKSIRYFADNIIEMHKKNIKCIANCAGNVPKWSESSLHVYATQMDKLLNYYIQNDNIQPINLFNLNLSRVLYPVNRENFVDCGAGKTRYVVDYDGKKYPCQMLSPLALTEEQLKNADKLDFWNCANYTISPCFDCILNAICPVCYGMSYIIYGDCLKRDINVCNTFKIEALACCRYQIHLLTKKNTFCEDDYFLAKAIKLIMNKINID